MTRAALLLLGFALGALLLGSVRPALGLVDGAVRPWIGGW
jgi:hypothetical protein